jgi:lysophospholipase L1-like esterase
VIRKKQGLEEQKTRMRDSYLLAAGLLTGLAIPTSTIPHLSIIESNNHQVLGNLKQSLQPVVGKSVIYSFDISLPEFISQATTEASLSKKSENTNSNLEISFPEFSRGSTVPVESSLNPNLQPQSRNFLSGNQLYYQRLAALKTGQIYTRLDDDSLQSMLVSGRKHQLSYEDWKGLLALEGRAMSQGQGANRLSILVGDSLSMWFPKQKLPAGKLWLNQAISGDTSTGIYRRLAYFSDTRPDVIYIMAGINDLRKGASDEVILRNHRRIIRRLHSSHPKAQIIVQSILPTRLPTISNSRIRNLNQQIAIIAQEEKANYLNIHNWFINSQGNLREELTTDGLHLSQEGYDVWRWALQQVEFKLAASRVDKPQ